MTGAGREGQGRSAAIAVTSLSLFRYGPFAARAWVFAQMGLSRGALRRSPGIGFSKLFGSGVGEGFTPRPNTAVWAILAEWPDLARAREACAEARPFADWRARAEESCTLLLGPLSRRGRWSGETPFEPASEEAAGASGPIAALTRATLRTRTLLRFWSREPAISAEIGANPDVLFKVGLGEVPWLHQVTFSVWPDSTAMDRFARRGPHARAIASARREGWFAEELYARFAVLEASGRWEGRDPLAPPTQDRRPAASSLAAASGPPAANPQGEAA